MPWQPLFIIVDLNLPKRYDYGWTERRIAVHLNLTQTTIHRSLNHNSRSQLNHNIQHLEGDCLELLKDIPELKQEALSLKYDYGWTERRIAGQLGVKKSTIHLWVPNNSHGGLPNNSTKITYLEGDCLELMIDLAKLVIPVELLPGPREFRILYTSRLANGCIVGHLTVGIVDHRLIMSNNSHRDLSNNSYCCDA